MTLGRTTHLSFCLIGWGTFFSEWRFNLKKQRKIKINFNLFTRYWMSTWQGVGGCFVVLDCSWLNPVFGILLNYCDVSIDTYYCAAEVISCCSCYSLWSPRKREREKKWRNLSLLLRPPLGFDRFSALFFEFFCRHVLLLWILSEPL